MKPFCAKKHCAVMFWGSLSLLQRSGSLKRAGAGERWWDVCVTGGYHTGGKQLTQAHLERLQQHWELTQVSRMSFLLAQSQTILPLCYNLDFPVSCSSLNEFQKQTLPCKERMRHCIGLSAWKYFVHHYFTGNSLFSSSGWFLKKPELWVNMLLSVSVS